MDRRITTLALLLLVVMGSNLLPKETPPEQAKSVTEAAKNIPQTRAPNSGLIPVVRVVDGDTIVVLENGVQEKVRLIGVNTPETVDPRRPVQCFGREASDFAKNLLNDKNVHLESDPTQNDRDKYHRLLRYVFLADGTLVNEMIIREGYGYEYTYHIPYRYQARFKEAERSARKTSRGLWAPGVCAQ